MVTEQGRPAAEAAAAEASFTMLLADTQEQVRLEQQAIERAMPIVEGLVLGTSRMSDSAIRMAAKQQPMVVLNRSVPAFPAWPSTTRTACGARPSI